MSASCAARRSSYRMIAALRLAHQAAKSASISGVSWKYHPMRISKRRLMRSESEMAVSRARRMAAQIKALVESIEIIIKQYAAISMARGIKL